MPLEENTPVSNYIFGPAVFIQFQVTADTGRPQGESHPKDIVRYIKKREKEAIGLYKQIKSFMRKDPGIRDAEIVKRLSKKGNPPKTYSNLPDIVKAATDQFSATDSSKLKERAVAAILAKDATIHFKQNISNNSVASILKSAKK